MDNLLCDNLERIKQRIQEICLKAGRSPSDVMLVAVSKTKPDTAILNAFECGQVHFGENRAKELQDKMSRIRKDDIVWHFVGPLQTNKIKYMTERTDWIQSVYKKKYLKEIEKRAGDIERSINVLIQVNISGEDQKQGCSPEALPGILQYAQDMKHLQVRGVMGMATFTDDRDTIRREFRLLREVFDNNRYLSGGAVRMDHVSMGMSHDFDIAIEEGATMVRIGTAIFGERSYG